MKTIGEIKEEFSAAREADWNAICQMYETDLRSGVQKLVQQYRKKLDALEKEKLRMEQMMQFEHKYEHLGYLCGIDEVGRGPLAGPVVACAVILPKDHHILYLNDSKKLTAHKREELYDVIMREAVAVGLGMASPARIDEINILQATYEAMRQAVSKLAVMPQLLLNDAVTIPGIEIPQVPIIKGDAKSASMTRLCRNMVLHLIKGMALQNILRLFRNMDQHRSTGQVLLHISYKLHKIPTHK